MLLRLILMVFVLNAFAPPAIAATCDMMGDTHMSSMSGMDSKYNSTKKSSPDAEVGCKMLQAQSCGSIDCLTSCVSSFPPIIAPSGDTSFFTKQASHHPKDTLLSLYKIFLPINTPPPLV